MWHEVNQRIMRTLKMKIYRVVIWPVVMYTTEVVCLTRNDEERLCRGIQGPKRIEQKEFWRLTNCVIEDILEGEDVVSMLKPKEFNSMDICTKGEKIQFREDHKMEAKMLESKKETNELSGGTKWRTSMTGGMLLKNQWCIKICSKLVEEM